MPPKSKINANIAEAKLEIEYLKQCLTDGQTRVTFAWSSKKMDAAGGWHRKEKCVYEVESADGKRSEMEISHLSSSATDHETGWDDMILLGRAIKWLPSESKKAEFLALLAKTESSLSRVQGDAPHVPD
jgi:hypothetical protein